MDNKTISDVLYEIADLLEMQSVDFKPTAYRKAARGVELSNVSVVDLYKKGGLNALEDIPGVGKHIALKIEELVKTGNLGYYIKLKSSLPKHISQLMSIPGLGPKKIKVLHEKLGIKDLKSLRRAIESHKIRQLEGFGEKSENEISRGIELVEKGSIRLLLWDALIFARNIQNKLRNCVFVDGCEIAGSLRRGKETIGDIDLLISSSSPSEVMDFFVNLKDVKRVLAKGVKKTSVIFSNDIQVDLRVVSKNEFGAALQYFTGSKEHNVALREIAIRKGLKLNEYGLFNKQSVCIASKTEIDIYKKLGFGFIPPDIRENSGELSSKIPKLIEKQDLVGDLHVHSNKSDGSNSVEDMILGAKKVGYGYVAITDHSVSERIAHGLSESEMEKHLVFIRSFSKKIRGIKILAGSEVDVLPSGKLDYPDKLLKKMDFVVISVHSGFKSSEEVMTQRICTALENKYVKVLAHPTGRLITRREAYSVNLKKIFESCVENKVALEINSQPQRMDLNDVYVRQAKNLGVKFVVNSDSHSVSELKFNELGVSIARRAWLESNDVLNTLPFDKFMKFFRK